MKHLVIKEIRALMLSSKFPLTLLACSLLILLSVFTGINEYKASLRLFETAQQIEATNFQEARNLMSASALVHRQPNPLHIFATGIHFDIGRLTSITRWYDPELSRSIYSETPIFALFRMLDLNFIFQAILTLFAILFTYDAISGEKESGTLKLTFSNSVSRSQYLIAKCIGNLIGLTAPLLIPILLGLLMIQAFGIQFSNTDWLAVLTFLLAGFFLIFVFLILGLCVSAWTQKSSHSFLLLLAVWIAFVLIIPRAGIIAADSMLTIPSDSELASMKSAYANERNAAYSKTLSEVFSKRDELTEGMTNEQAEAFRNEKEFEWTQEIEQLRNEKDAEISAYGVKLMEDVNNKKLEKARMAFKIARISPIASFQLIAMNLSQTDLQLKTRYQRATQQYKSEFTNYLEQKQKETGDPGGIRIEMSDQGFKFDMGRETGLDFSDRPQFQHPELALSERFSNILSDMLLLLLNAVVLFAIGFVGFLRYDMR
jgi:ABC-type transport system involved in multi-copper enzyme maturation permease subunit